MHNIHHQLMSSIVHDIDRAIARTGKSPNQIFDELFRLHPEVTFTLEDWHELRTEVQTAIVTRIKITLAKMS